MYRGTIPHTYPKSNLKNLLLENGSFTKRLPKFTSMICRISAPDAFRTIQYVKYKFESYIKLKLFGKLQQKLSSVPFRHHSANVWKIWAHQCECVMAQRLRRGQQMFCLYSKLWEERALREFFKQMCSRVTIRGKDFVFGAIGIAAYDWQTNRIPDKDIRQYLNELDYVYLLKDKTLCITDSDSRNLDCESRICHCENSNHSPKVSSYDDWKVFIERKDMVVWRRTHASGHYEYKVYGSYNDVSAEDFLNVQIDTNYRRQWDSTAVSLEVIEQDPEPSSNSDIIYWEMLWPRLFVNRDYVFNRRYMVDYKSKTVLLVSKGTEHPHCPENENKHRVRDYWSYMVIKPYTDLNKPGIEFSLTYFDNPGVNIPATVTAWVAMRAMPDFLERLRDATKKYKSYCKQEGISCIYSIMDVPVEDENDDGEESDLRWDFYDVDNVITDNTIFEAQYNIKRPEERKSKPSKKPPQNVDEGENTANAIIQQSTNVQSENNHSFWRYLHPTYYFS